MPVQLPLARSPWVQCHGSTLAVIGDRVLVAFFAGTAEGTADTEIWLSAREGDRWTDPRVVSVAPGPRWNPVLAEGPDGALWLFSRQGTPISAWRTLVRRSLDGGRTWDEEHELVPGDRSGGRGPVRTPPVFTANGTWVAGGSVETADGRWDCFADLSADHGRTWRRRPIPLDHAACRGAGAIQPSLWTDGERVTALLRTTDGRAWRAGSVDAGENWTPAAPTDLPNNNSGLAAVRLPSGRIWCAHNPSGESWGPRHELVWSTSDDDGRHWRRGGLIEAVAPTPSRPVGADSGVVTDGVGELSYPTVVIDDDRLLVSYTWQRRRIAVADLPLTGLNQNLTPPRANGES